MYANEEWLSSNAEASFPFRESCFGVAGAVPAGLFVDLKLCLAGSPVLDIFLSALSYDATGDAYMVVFSSTADGSNLFGATITRLKAGSSRVFLPQVLLDGLHTLLFTPGPTWDAPQWNGADSWSVSFSTQQAALEFSAVNPGAQSFRRIFIDGLDIPPRSAWPMEATQKLVAGYNIAFNSGSGPGPGSPAFGNLTSANFVNLSAEAGLGAGFAPPDVPPDYIAMLSGQGPDTNGNIQLTPVDCLRISQPLVAGVPLPSTLQFSSDCLPCCPCSDYRAVSEAINRVSAKMVDVCTLLNTILADSVSAYNDGVATINSRRPPMAVSRNVRALGSQVIFGVQNTSSVPLYCYVAIKVAPDLGGFEVADGQPNVRPLQVTPTDIPTMAFVPGENPGNSLPVRFLSLPYTLVITVGQNMSGNTFAPIQPGQNVDVVLSFPAVETAITALIAAHASTSALEAATVAAALPTLTFQTAVIYGSSKCYGCAADIYEAAIQVTAVPPDASSSICGVDFQNQYVAVQIPL